MYTKLKAHQRSCKFRKNKREGLIYADLAIGMRSEEMDSKRDIVDITNRDVALDFKQR
jgi:hypothetical protein